MQQHYQNLHYQTNTSDSYFTYQQLNRKQKILDASSKANNQRFLIAVIVFGITIILGFVYFTFQFKYWNSDIKIQGQQISQAFRQYTEESNMQIKQQITLLEQKIQDFKLQNTKNQRQIILSILNINDQFENLKSKTIKINQLIKKQNDKKKYDLASHIVTNVEDVKLIISFFLKPIKSFKLLYRATENNFQVSKFHQKCDKIPNTLILIKTQEQKIIGGFTQLLWDKNLDEKWSKDDKNQTFIFSLPLKEKMHLVKPGTEAIKNYEKIGPVFAGVSGPADLIIFDKSNTHQSSFIGFPNAYNNEKKYIPMPSSRQEFLNSKFMNANFKIVEWEVFQLEFR